MTDSPEDVIGKSVLAFVVSELQFQKKATLAATRSPPIIFFFIIIPVTAPLRLQDSYADFFCGVVFLKKEIYAARNVNFVKFSLCKHLFTKIIVEIHRFCRFKAR